MRGKVSGELRGEEMGEGRWEWSGELRGEEMGEER